MSLLTHCHSYAEEPTDDPIHLCIQFLVACLCTVHGPIHIFTHAQAKQIGFANDEVEILVVDLRNAVRGSCSRRLSSKVLEKGSRHRRQKVDVCRGVKVPGKILGNQFEVRGRRFDKV